MIIFKETKDTYTSAEVYDTVEVARLYNEAPDLFYITTQTRDCFVVCTVLSDDTTTDIYVFCGMIIWCRCWIDSTENVMYIHNIEDISDKEKQIMIATLHNLFEFVDCSEE